MTILYLIFLLILLSAAYGAVSAAPWLPTKSNDVRRMIKLAKIKPGQTVYDLGCGDGRVVFSAANAGAKAKGVEIFILPYLYAKIKSFFIKNSRIIFGDFFNINLADADVAYVFLTTGIYPRLIKKLEAEMKPGSRVIAYCFEIKHWKEKLIALDIRERRIPIYSYQV